MTIWRFDAIGTLWEIETSHELGADDRERVGAEIERFDREWSRFREDSSVTRVGRDGGSISSPDAGAMLDAYRDLSRASSGAVNPLVAGSLDALGYDASYSLVASSPIAAPADWTDRVRWTAGRPRHPRRLFSTSGHSAKGVWSISWPGCSPTCPVTSWSMPEVI